MEPNKIPKFTIDIDFNTISFDELKKKIDEIKTYSYNTRVGVITEFLDSDLFVEYFISMKKSDKSMAQYFLSEFKTEIDEIKGENEKDIEEKKLELIKTYKATIAKFFDGSPGSKFFQSEVEKEMNMENLHIIGEISNDVHLLSHINNKMKLVFERLQKKD